MEYGLPLVLDMETGLADYFGVDGGEANYPTILPLEYKCFEAASIPNLLQGMLYICPLFYKNSLFVRYIATGAYRGILCSGYVAETNKSPTLKNLPMAAVHSQGSVIAC